MDVNQARINMVDCQLAPGGITDEALLDLYRVFPRHIFAPSLPGEQAYRDGGCALGGNRFLLDPHVEALMLQALTPQAGDIGLVISCGSVSSAGMLSHLLQTVFVRELTAATAKKADALLVEQSLCNCVCSGGYRKAIGENGPYDCILVAGACASVPQIWVDQLKQGGRMVLAVRPDERNPANLVFIGKDHDGTVSQSVLRQVSCPYICGFEPQEVFAL